jgi:L-Ala-D/L-Glu epimerase
LTTWSGVAHGYIDLPDAGEPDVVAAPTILPKLERKSMKFKFRRVDWEYTSVFRISYQTQTHAQTVLVELEEGGLVGRGEAMGVSYHGETVETLLEQLAAMREAVSNGVSRADLYSLLPAGGARNALDCALWDLEAKRTGRRAWDLAGFQSVRPLATDFTLGLDTPEAMGRAAAAKLQFPVLKLKMDGHGDLDRIAAVRRSHPNVQLTVDANQSWKMEDLQEVVPRLAQHGVVLIEQPLPVGEDDALTGFDSPIPLCADESCQTSESLAAVRGKYEYVNIKLDKTGGLTEALRLARLAEEEGYKLMVGCMGGSSLAMAPAFIIGQLCNFADLDGPLLAKSDIANGIRYEGSLMHIPDRLLWG